MGMSFEGVLDGLLVDRDGLLIAHAPTDAESRADNGVGCEGVIRTDDYAANPSEFSFAMVAVLVGAAVTTIAATYYKLPISATHGIVGGLIGVGAMAHGWGSLGGTAIAKTVASWVISPVLGGAVAFALFLLVHRLG